MTLSDQAVWYNDKCIRFEKPMFDCRLEQELTVCPLLPVHVLMISGLNCCATVGLAFLYSRDRRCPYHFHNIQIYICRLHEVAKETTFHREVLDYLQTFFFTLTKEIASTLSWILQTLPLNLCSQCISLHNSELCPGILVDVLGRITSFLDHLCKRCE